MSEPEYGMDKLPSNQFRRIARGYAQKIMRLRRNLVYPTEPAEGMTDAEYQVEYNQALANKDRKIERLKDKLRAIVKELLRRVNLPNLQLTVLSGNRTTFPRIMAKCPACSNTVNFVDAVVYEEGRLGVRCPSCGLERWES